MSAAPAEEPRGGLPPHEPGHLIAPGYRVMSHVSRGDALDVYEVWSLERRCSCVAKSIRPERRAQTRVRRRLLREGRLLQSLGHPHLVRAYASYTQPEPVVILETLPGPTLEDLLAERTRPFGAGDLGHLGTHLASAAAYLHAHGYVHLDVNPSNVVAQGGMAKVIDLSLARRPGRVPRGHGTRPYLAPEQALGGEVGPATDAWGIGATLYDAATGTAPFDPDNDADVAVVAAGGYLQLHRPPVALRRRRRSLPAKLAALIHRCLDPDPAHRPTPDELLEEFPTFTPPQDDGADSDTIGRGERALTCRTRTTTG